MCEIASRAEYILLAPALRSLRSAHLAEKAPLPLRMWQFPSRVACAEHDPEDGGAASRDGPILTVFSTMPDVHDLSETRDLRPLRGMMILGRRRADSKSVAVGTQRRFPAFPLANTAGAAPTGKNVAGFARAACVVSHRRRPQQPPCSVADKGGDSRRGNSNRATAFLGKGRFVAFRVGCLVTD